MKRFLILGALLGVGCTGGDIDAVPSGTGGDAPVGQHGGAGGGDGHIIAPITGGQDAGRPGSGGMDAAGGAGGSETGGATGGVMQDPLDLGDILPGTWTLTRQAQQYTCNGEPAGAPDAEQTFEVTITDTFQAFTGPSLIWEPGALTTDRWEPDTSPTKTTWSALWLAADTADHLVGEGELRLATGACPGVVLKTWVFELRR